MGYCEIIPIKNGEPQDGIEFHNPWRGASRIWDSLFDQYLKDPEKEYDSWLSNFRKDQGQPLWDLAKRDDLSMPERSVHAFTFDRAYVLKSDFTRLANDLRVFEEMYPVDFPSHLSAWAETIEALDAEAVALRATSVSENPWYYYNEEDDETIPYTIEDGFNLYEWLAEMAGQNAQAMAPDGDKND